MLYAIVHNHLFLELYDVVLEEFDVQFVCSVEEFCFGLKAEGAWFMTPRKKTGESLNRG